MKKKYVLSLVLLIAASGYALAQSVSKQINDIMRSNEYITAEATLETEAKAYELAEELLSKRIEEYVNEKKTLKNAPNVIVKDVAGKAEQLKMNRGTMTRVFLFVKKDDVMAADNTRVLVQPKNVPTAPVTVKPKNASKPKEPVKKKEEKEESKKEEKQEETVLVSTVEPVNTPPVANGDQSLRLAKSWQQDAIDELLACSNVTEARAKMNRLRIGLKIKRFGSADSCKNPEKCFWLIFNEQEQVVTILGPGTDSRTNFRSLTKDNLKNYTGQGAIWFTLAN